MPHTQTQMREALLLAKAWMAAHPNVTGVSQGYKWVNGRKTDRVVLVFSVGVKKTLAEVAAGEVIPPSFGGVETDVIEGTFTASALTQRRRPCPAGFSMGHVKITAGTFGLPVKRGASDEILILTNNHVAANSNDAQIGDRIIQPGKADGGADQPGDWFATLLDFVTIGFDSAPPPPKKNRVLGLAWWATIRALGNAGGWVARCPYRVRVGPLAVEQPRPNLVDAALCRPNDPAFVLPEVHGVGPVAGIQDLVLGQRVQKVGRTTEHTFGVVDGINGMVRVGYGGSNVAIYDDQVTIRGENGAEFSAGGDSGSAILTEDGFAGGLLFAGGDGQTIANKMSHVVALLGVRV